MTARVEVPALTRSQQRWTLVATVLGSAMVFIDGTVVNVALPILQRDFGASLAGAQWVVEAYAVVLAALILVGGALGDRFGRRRVFVLGVVVFASGSVWCGLAPTIGHLIVARGIQGLGGALLTPGSLAIIEATFAPADRGRAIGTWSGFSALTTALGPVLGGWLIDHAGWRWVFFLNVPLAIVTIAVTVWRVPESRDDAGRPLDISGALLATIGLGLVVYGLLEAGSAVNDTPGRALSSPSTAVALVGLLALVGFVIVEWRSRSPMIPLDLFASRAFSGANLLTLLFYAGLGGALFFLPYDLLQVQHYSATAAGSALVPLAILLFALSRWAGGLVHRYGARLPLIAGPLIAAAGFVLFARPSIVASGAASYWTTFFPAAVVLGLGLVVTVAPLTTVAMGSVPAHRAGLASGVNNAVARTASVLAVAALGLVGSLAFRARFDRELAEQGIPPLDRARMVNLGVRALGDSSTAHTAAHAFVGAFRLVMAVAAALALASAAVAAVLIPGRVEEP